MNLKEILDNVNQTRIRCGNPALTSVYRLEIEYFNGYKQEVIDFDLGVEHNYMVKKVVILEQFERKTV